jgi:DNA mismatch repair protein MutL
MKKVGGAQPWESLYTVLADERKGSAEQEAGLGMADPAAAGFSPEGQQMLTLPGGEDDNEASQPVQLHGRYVLWPIKSGFLLLDQRAAHERILYEKYRGRLAAEAGMVQRQLFPQTLELSPADAVTLKELLPAVNALGFDLQAAENDTFVVHGTPADCAEMDDRLAVDELLAAFRRLGDIGELKPRERVARSLARSYAMPPGRTLDATAMRDLVDRLFACETPYAAPDGQATFLTFTLDELAARFRKR